MKSIQNAKNMFLPKVWNYPLDDAPLLALYTETSYWQW